MRPEPDLPNIVSNFDLDGEIICAEPYGFGHINDTYLVLIRKSSGSTERYILQRINHFVFNKPEELMENVVSVTAHLRNKIIAAGGNPDRETLTLIPTKNNSFFYRMDGGDYWRVYIFIEDALSYQIPESLNHVYNAAWAYGKFQQLLSDFPVDQLHETIPDFHNTAKRFRTFVRVLEKDSQNRAHSVKREIDFVVQRANQTSRLIDMLNHGSVPIRVTHNDTKYDNVMIDNQSGEGICVIDLDTVMPGLSLYDFGDAVRSITNTADEDERDLKKVSFNLAMFEEFAKGYLAATNQALTIEEVDNLAFAAWLMTLECGMRFLTDYLDGDIYFRTKRKDHNLDRTRTQFKLVKEMEAHFDKMSRIVLDNA